MDPFRHWRETKYNDEKVTRIKEARELERDLLLRQRSRYNRALTEEEDRRVRLTLEGLVLERRVPPREEFPGARKKDFRGFSSSVFTSRTV